MAVRRRWSGRRIVWVGLAVGLLTAVGIVIAGLLYEARMRQTIRDAGGTIGISAELPWWLQWTSRAEWLEPPELLLPVSLLNLRDVRIDHRVWQAALHVCGPELFAFSLSDQLSDEQLRQLTSRLPGLLSLEANGSHLTPSGLHSLLNCPNLEDLYLTGLQSNGNALDVLPELKQLQSLMLFNGEFQAADLRTISRCRRLSYLACGNIMPPATQFERPVDLLQLQSLYLDGSGVSDDFVSQFARSPKLQFIGLDDTPVTGACLKQLSTLPGLIWLDLDGTSLEEQYLRHLRAFPKVGSVNLSNTLISDAAVPLLLQCTTLRFLHLDGTRVSEEGLKQLQEQFPDCRITPEPAAVK
ncbi:MAG: hypothetical protein KDA79_06230 [Planctomycetaceae bacterium]|nr:hypothetical protein [Planctomycetaceae bacterium]